VLDESFNRLFKDLICIKLAAEPLQPLSGQCASARHRGKGHNINTPSNSFGIA